MAGERAKRHCGAGPRPGSGAGPELRRALLADPGPRRGSVASPSERGEEPKSVQSPASWVGFRLVCCARPNYRNSMSKKEFFPKVFHNAPSPRPRGHRAAQAAPGTGLRALSEGSQGSTFRKSFTTLPAPVPGGIVPHKPPRGRGSEHFPRDLKEERRCGCFRNATKVPQTVWQVNATR